LADTMVKRLMSLIKVIVLSHKSLNNHFTDIYVPYIFFQKCCEKASK